MTSTPIPTHNYQGPYDLFYGLANQIYSGLLYEPTGHFIPDSYSIASLKDHLERYFALRSTALVNAARTPNLKHWADDILISMMGHLSGLQANIDLAIQNGWSVGQVRRYSPHYAFFWRLLAEGSEIQFPKTVPPIPEDQLAKMLAWVKRPEAALVVGAILLVPAVGLIAMNLPSPDIGKG